MNSLIKRLRPRLHGFLLVVLEFSQQQNHNPIGCDILHHTVIASGISKCPVKTLERDELRTNAYFMYVYIKQN